MSMLSFTKLALGMPLICSKTHILFLINGDSFVQVEIAKSVKHS